MRDGGKDDIGRRNTQNFVVVARNVGPTIGRDHVVCHGGGRSKKGDATGPFRDDEPIDSPLEPCVAADVNDGAALASVEKGRLEFPVGLVTTRLGSVKPLIEGDIHSDREPTFAHQLV